MKTFIKILLILSLLIGVGCFFGCSQGDNPIVVDVESLPEYSFKTEIIGNSMTELGLKSGDVLDVYPNLPCNVGDICLFRCLVDRCKTDGLPDSFKKVESIENGCYYFVGNSRQWYEGDVLAASWDSRVFGALCPGEVKIWGVVK